MKLYEKYYFVESKAQKKRPSKERAAWMTEKMKKVAAAKGFLDGALVNEAKVLQDGTLSGSMETSKLKANFFSFTY